MKRKVIGYWTTTLILALALLSGGAAQLSQQRETVEGTLRLGYPAYFIAMLGFWKLTGAITLLVPRFPRLKEWAYAGIFFEMTGAAMSHAVCGGYGAYAFHFLAPLTFALLAIISRALGPSSRT